MILADTYRPQMELLDVKKTIQQVVSMIKVIYSEFRQKIMAKFIDFEGTNEVKADHLRL